MTLRGTPAAVSLVGAQKELYIQICVLHTTHLCVKIVSLADICVLAEVRMCVFGGWGDSEQLPCPAGCCLLPVFVTYDPSSSLHARLQISPAYIHARPWSQRESAVAACGGTYSRMHPRAGNEARVSGGKCREDVPSSSTATQVLLECSMVQRGTVRTILADGTGVPLPSSLPTPCLPHPCGQPVRTSDGRGGTVDPRPGSQWAPTTGCRSWRRPSAPPSPS